MKALVFLEAVSSRVCLSGSVRSSLPLSAGSVQEEVELLLQYFARHVCCKAEGGMFAMMWSAARIRIWKRLLALTLMPF